MQVPMMKVKLPDGTEEERPIDHYEYNMSHNDQSVSRSRYARKPAPLLRDDEMSAETIDGQVYIIKR